MPEATVLGNSYPRVDAADKVSGRSQYAGDVYLPGMLIGKVLKSIDRMPASCASTRPKRSRFPASGP